MTEMRRLGIPLPAKHVDVQHASLSWEDLQVVPSAAERISDDAGALHAEGDLGWPCRLRQCALISPYKLGRQHVYEPCACRKGCSAEACCACCAVVQHRRHPEGEGHPLCARALDGLLPAEGRGPCTSAVSGLHAAARPTSPLTLCNGQFLGLFSRSCSP